MLLSLPALAFDFPLLISDKNLLTSSALYLPVDCIFLCLWLYGLVGSLFQSAKSVDIFILLPYELKYLSF